MTRSFVDSQPMGRSSPLHASDLKEVALCHPGYNPPRSGDFLYLPAIDDNGLHHGTALEASRIVACNIDGFLSPSPDRNDSQQSLDGAPLDHILTGTKYYFHAREPPFHYPICPSFRAWQFPHGNIPASWENLRVPRPPLQECRIQRRHLGSHSYRRAVLSVLDEQCCVSGYSTTAGDAAFLVPDQQWFDRNHMDQYVLYRTRRHTQTQNVDNLIFLRDDLRRLFEEDYAWVLVPKAGRSVAHFLNWEAPELMEDFHNVPAMLPARTPPELLYAHFAWAILHNLMYASEDVLIATLAENGERTLGRLLPGDLNAYRNPTPPPPDSDSD